MKEGLEQGIMQTIKNMLSGGMDVSLISKVSCKTEKEILEINKTLEL